MAKINGTLQSTGLQIIEYYTPTTGTTVNIIGSDSVIIDPAGTILALTVNLPASQNDGKLIKIVTSQVVTGLTMAATGGATVLGALTAAVLNGFAHYIYKSSTNKWYRCG